jgi:mono/diheme cytochrome c family protein
MQIGLPVKIALVVAALFLLLGNVFIIYKNYDTEWRHYQTEYLTMVTEKTTDPQMKEIFKARSPRIEQLVITGFGKERVDRCMTCHMGIDDPNFANAPQPFRTHPKMPGNHPYRSFGCTTCHMGNGRGLSVFDAHGKDKYWMEPLLKGKFIEVGCAKCHPAPFIAETPTLKKGAELFHKSACYGCHKIQGVSEGKLGPELTRVGAKWGIPYLKESIVFPKANTVFSIMPTFALKEDEIEALTVYLKSLTGENLVLGPVTLYDTLKAWKAIKPKDVDVTVERGQQLFTEMACNACHTINGVGGKIGPDLSVYGNQRTKEYMIQHHINPRTLIGGSIMPDFPYSKSELEALALYLSSLKTLTADNAVVYAPPATPAQNQ